MVKLKSKLWRDWSCLLLQQGPPGVLCIQKPGNDYWEFPGGKRHSNDRKPEVTAVREDREETGVRLLLSEITLVGSTQEFNHRTHQPWALYFYCAHVSAEKLATHLVLSREGEKVAILTWEQLNAMGDRFSPFHRMLAKKFGVWRTK